MKNLAIRSLSGIVLAVVMLGAIVWSPWSYGALFAALLVAGMLEFYALAAARGAAPQRLLGLTAGLLLFGLGFLFASEGIRVGTRDRCSARWRSCCCCFPRCSSASSTASRRIPRRISARRSRASSTSHCPACSSVSSRPSPPRGGIRASRSPMCSSCGPTMSSPICRA